MAKGRGQTLIQRSRQVPASVKAQGHTEGVGRSKVKRDFFGLNSSDEQVILDRVQEGVDKALRSNY